jgi:hypothetical protein
MLKKKKQKKTNKHHLEYGAFLGFGIFNHAKQLTHSKDEVMRSWPCLITPLSSP